MKSLRYAQCYSVILYMDLTLHVKSFTQLKVCNKRARRLPEHGTQQLFMALSIEFGQSPLGQGVRLHLDMPF